MQPFNITDTTCQYSVTGSDCSIPYSTFNQTEYHTSQLIYCLLGIVGVAASAYKFGIAVQNASPSLQLRAFIICFFCSMTFLGRSVDPQGYGCIIPHIVGITLIDACTAAIYTILVNSAIFWISITQGSVHTQRPSRITIFENVIVMSVWVFHIGFDLTLIGTKGFGRFPYYIRDLGASIILFVIAAVLLTYGLRICARLKHIDRMANLEPGLSITLAIASLDCISIEEGQTRVMETPQMDKPIYRAKRMQHLLIAITFVAALGIGFQVYTAFAMPLNGIDKQLACSNGVLEACLELEATVKPLHYVQFVAICAVLWGYRTIRIKPNAES
uniref:Uncharacterized protein AlNc14C160G7755 n=1 Tax=Albugo laibachii Nc14 TaxID=890382 RepID=F0WMR9_9STRA|nr:conserved hypothetical protein [Albugo laibachii Nc14]|eukprot:CCA22604.1 conserved hypothetical protein [Albugo laibachii Nc14]